MKSDDGESLGRDAPFPREMQGHWIEESDPPLEMIVEGSDISWDGHKFEYHDKIFWTDVDGNVSITLEFDDGYGPEYSVNMIALPDGNMYVYTLRSVSLYTRNSA